MGSAKNGCNKWEVQKVWKCKKWEVQKIRSAKNGRCKKLENAEKCKNRWRKWKIKTRKHKRIPANACVIKFCHKNTIRSPVLGESPGRQKATNNILNIFRYWFSWSRCWFTRSSGVYN